MLLSDLCKQLYVVLISSTFFAVEEVKLRMMRKQCMDIQVAACPVTDKVVVKNIGQNVCTEEIALYFEDKRNCPVGGDVLNVEPFGNRKSAIVQFLHQSGMCYFNVRLSYVV